MYSAPVDFLSDRSQTINLLRKRQGQLLAGSLWVGTQVLYKQNDPSIIRVNLMYAGPPVLRVTFMYKGSILCTTDPYTIRVNLM